MQTTYVPVNLRQWMVPFSSSVIRVQIRSAVVFTAGRSQVRIPLASGAFSVWSLHAPCGYLELTLGVNLSVNGCSTAR